MNDIEQETNAARRGHRTEGCPYRFLTEECTVSNDWARSEGGFDPAAATACVRDGEYLLAVVALEGLTCAESGDDVRPIREDDLTRLNQMRTFEVAVLANPNACPSLENALGWARVQLDVYGESLTVRGVPGAGTGCYVAMTYWDWDEVIVEQTSIPIGVGGTGVSSTSSTTTP